jgi:hypothetical protein
MIGKLHKPVLVITALSVMAMACGLTNLRAEVAPEMAAQTVEAELTRIALAAPTDPPTEIPPSDEPVEETATPPPPTNTPSPPTPTAGVEGCTDKASFVADVTVPDGSDFDKGESFTKTWRLRNDGTCTWTSSYALAFDHGDQMGAPASQPLAGAVPPGSTVDISVNLTAPNDYGEYQGFFKLRNNSNVLFGIGAGGNTAFWVQIDVPEPEPDPTDTPLVLIPVTLIPITLIPIFNYSSGENQLLNEGACFDLDAGNPVGCGSASADFRYDYTISGFPPTSRQNYDQVNGTQARFINDNSPTKADCQALSMSSNPFDMDPGDEYCYKTSDGRYGYIHVDQANFDSLIFDWVTFN